MKDHAASRTSFYYDYGQQIKTMIYSKQWMPPSRNLKWLCLICFGILIYTTLFVLSGTNGRTTYWTNDENFESLIQKFQWTKLEEDNLQGEAPPEMPQDDTIGSGLSIDEDLRRVENSTLGFEKVFVIGLQERSDKRDAMELMAATSGFSIDWINGVKPSSIPNKAVPDGINPDNVHDNFLGSWRGHMDTIRLIVKSGVSSALIMEDDMDWDINIKRQLRDVARGSRQIFFDGKPVPSSPYGDDWDILWLGHCGEPFPETLEEHVGLEPELKDRISDKYIIKNDDTVPPYSEVSRLVDWSDFAPGTRVIHRSGAPICSFAYAVSQRAAKKLLYALSVNGLHMAFDNSLAQLCRDAAFDLTREKDDGYGMKCVSVNPTLMFHHRPKGRISGDSDIQSYGEDGGIREKGVTESIKWSMRLNLYNVIMGKAPTAQFQDSKNESSSSVNAEESLQE